MTTLLVVGGADTGRAPLVVALLRQRLSAQAVTVESAGVLGHDGDSWQPEARLALQHLGFTPHEHVARSLTEELAQSADLLLTVDRGVARAVELRFGVESAALPDLAGAVRDVVDPFRMTLDSWLVYARELDQQIRAALPKIRQALGMADGNAAASEPAPSPAAAAPPAQPALAAPPIIQRLRTLVSGIAGLPEVIDWAKARAAIREALQLLAAAVSDPSDLRPGAVAMLIGVLGQEATPLSPGQLAMLREIVEQLAQPLDGMAVGQIAGQIGRWSQL